MANAPVVHEGGVWAARSELLLFETELCSYPRMAPPSAAGSIFNAKARCNKCHALTDTRRGVVNFMDYDFHNIRI